MKTMYVGSRTLEGQLETLKTADVIITGPQGLRRDQDSSEDLWYDFVTNTEENAKKVERVLGSASVSPRPYRSRQRVIGGESFYSEHGKFLVRALNFSTAEITRAYSLLEDPVITDTPE